MFLKVFQKLRSGFSIVESMNPYSYVGHNPVKSSDPTGEFLFLDDFLMAAVAKLFSDEDTGYLN
jgi:hypothetical protein